MGGSNKQPSSGAMATPEIRQATLPTAADYRYEDLMSRQDDIKQQNFANYINNANKNIQESLGAFKQPSGMLRQPRQQQNNSNMWRNMQSYSQSPGSNALQFTPLSPQQVFEVETVFDTNPHAAEKALIGAIGNVASGALSGLSMSGGSTRGRG
jgi:hypothetical protein